MTNKFVTAAFFALVAILGSIQAGVTQGNLTTSGLYSAIAAGIGVGLFKLMDPQSVVSLPPVVSAVILAVVATIPVFNEANTDLAISVQEWIGVAIAFVTALMAKLTTPTSKFTMTARPFRVTRQAY